MMNSYFNADIMTFEKVEHAEKQKMIDDAISETDRKLYYSRQCLLAMIKWQKELLAEAYAAFDCAQLTQADFADERI